MTFLCSGINDGAKAFFLETDKGEIATLFVDLPPDEPEDLAWLRLQMIWSALCLAIAAGMAQTWQLNDLAEVAFGWPDPLQPEAPR